MSEVDGPSGRNDGDEGDADVEEPMDGEQVDRVVLSAVFGPNEERAERYASMLAGRGTEWGLIGPHEVNRLWSRHLFNSVAPADLIAWGSSVVDVGSGAGMPGLPLALARPDLSVTLLEPQERRHEFLQIAVDELDLADRVRLARSRSEEYRDRFDVVTSRAVAPLPRLLREQWHLRSPGGMVLAIKGASAAHEIAKAKPELTKRKAQADLLQVRAHPRAEPTSVVRVRGK